MSVDKSAVEDLQHRVSKLESEKWILFKMIWLLAIVVFALGGIIAGGGFVLVANVIQLEERTYGTNHFILIVLSVVVGGMLGGWFGSRFHGWYSGAHHP